MNTADSTSTLSPSQGSTEILSARFTTMRVQEPAYEVDECLTKISKEECCEEVNKIVSTVNLSQADTEDLIERFTILRKQETVYEVDDFLSKIRKECCEEGKKVVDEKCRSTMTTWCYKILDFCSCSHEIVSVAMSHVDRFLTTEMGNFVLYDRRWFQLAVMCALQVSIKMHESGKLDMGALIQLGRGAFNEDEIIGMEEEILFALRWRLCPPTPFVLLEALVELIPSELTNVMRNVLLKLSKKQIFLTVPLYSFVKEKPSYIAFASILNAMDEMKLFPPDARRAFIHNAKFVVDLGRNDSKILQLRSRIHEIMSTKPEKKKLKNSRSCATLRDYSHQNQDSPVCVRQAVVNNARLGS